MVREDASVSFRAVAFRMKFARTVMVVGAFIAFCALAFEIILTQFRSIRDGFAAERT